MEAPDGVAILKYKTKDGRVMTCQLLITEMQWNTINDVTKLFDPNPVFIPGRQSTVVQFSGVTMQIDMEEERKILSGVRALDV